MERWRVWTPPVDIVDQPDEIIVEGDVKSRSYNVKWPAEMVERIRVGRVCLKCFEPQEESFPERCANPVCGYPIRKDQVFDFGLEFQGEEQFVGDSQRDWQEIERLEEAGERKKWGKASRTSKIVVPRGFR